MLFGCLSFWLVNGELSAQIEPSNSVWIRSNELELLFTPDPEPLLDGDLVGGTLSLETAEGSTIVTFGEISMSNLHHVGVPQIIGITPTLTVADHRDPNHALFDSHLLITPDMIGGSAGPLLRETGFDDPNAVDPTGNQDRIPADMFGNPANTYRGDFVHGNGAFFLLPEFQSNSIDFARLVGRPGDVSAFRFEVLGGGVSFDHANFEFELAWRLPEGNPPTIQFDAPVGLVEIGDTVVLSAAANDVDGDLALVEFFDNGVLISACTFTTIPYECAWTPPTSGVHTLRATAIDENGNRTLSDLATVYTDALPPLITLSTDLNPIVIGDSLTLTADATARDGEIVSVEFFANNELIPGCSFAALPYECEWMPELAGDYRIRARAITDFGSIGYSSVTRLRVDGFAIPLITLTTDDSPKVVGESITLAADATARAGEIVLVEFFADNELIPDCSITSLPYECVWTPETAGSYNLAARAVDDFGGVGDSDVLRVRVESDSPLVFLTIDSGSIVLGDNYTLSADATARTGEIVLVEFLANDELIPGCSLATIPYECEWTPDTLGFHNLRARATDDSSRVGVSANSRVSVVSPLEVTLSSPPRAGTVNRALLTGESLTLAADVEQRNGEAIVLVEFLANDELIPECSFTVEPYQCEWTPDEGEHVVFARAEDAVGNRQDSPTGVVTVFPPGAGGIGEGLPRDENGNIIVDDEFLTPGGFGGPPSPIRPGFPVFPLDIFLPVADGRPVTLVAIEEIADAADRFAYVGDPPPLRFESRNVRVGPFEFEPPLFTGEFSAMYELTFDDGSHVVATLSANVIPEPATFGGSVLCWIGLFVCSRKRRFVDHG